jgi:hypothetical protein
MSDPITFEREARAILAVAQPDQGIMRFHPLTLPPLHTPYGDALAESLSAFLGAPDPAEWLKARQ